jgi:outer membrane biosynthesis protein TonB
MKKTLILTFLFCIAITAVAYEYVPKNTDTNPFGNKSQSATQIKQDAKKQEMREIMNITEYFRYLPAEVHRHWTPYKAERDYEIAVRFIVHRDGSISETQIVSTDYPAANASVLKAVKSGAPYQPLPKSYKQDSVKAQILLEYHNKQ